MSAGGPRALVTGADGQVGRELRARVPAGWEVLPCGRAALDVTDQTAVLATVERERPRVIINAGAFTGVDAAESEAEVAEAVNARGARHMAIAARRVSARLIHLSTDYVFDGTQSHPYAPDDTPNPLNVYGRTKLAGEREVARIGGTQALILRTAWLYSSHGRNFLRTMLRRMGDREALTVVADQIGTPTWAGGLADVIWMAADRPDMHGVHHWTDAGTASWYEFAVAIQEEALLTGQLDRAIPIRPIRSDDFPAAARRPAYSALDQRATGAALGLTPRHWRGNLRLVLEELARA